MDHIDFNQELTRRLMAAGGVRAQGIRVKFTEGVPLRHVFERMCAEMDDLLLQEICSKNAPIEVDFTADDAGFSRLVGDIYHWVGRHGKEVSVLAHPSALNLLWSANRSYSPNMISLADFPLGDSHVLEHNTLLIRRRGWFDFSNEKTVSFQKMMQPLMPISLTDYASDYADTKIPYDDYGVCDAILRPIPENFHYIKLVERHED